MTSRGFVGTLGRRALAPVTGTPVTDGERHDRHRNTSTTGRQQPLDSRLESNRSRVLERIAAAARAAGRGPDEVELVAVTKSVAPELAGALFDLGCQDLAENRASALEEKHAAFLAAGRSARWHFVGHLQRNKARRVLRLAHAIHSVDSAPLWETLARQALEERRFPGVYLQLKLADEDAKGGLAPEELPALVERARGGPLPLLGLMVMAPLLADPEAARRAARAVFERAAVFARTLPGSAFVDGRVRLSMGMSDDFEEAVRAGAHVVRVGSLLFAGCDADARARRDAS